MQGIFLTSVTVLAILVSVKADECTTVFKGCNVEKGQCVCGEMIDCVNPYPYKDQLQCQRDLKGELDKCKREPCVHGQCVQAKHDLSRRWECSCAGSGYYGRKCDQKCPAFDKLPLPEGFPSDCVY